MNHQQRLEQWATPEFREVEFWAEPELTSQGLTLWHVMVDVRASPFSGRNTRVRIEAGPADDLETCCRIAIERLEVVGIAVP